MAQAVSRRPLTVEAKFASGSVHVGFVVDKVALGEVFPKVLQFYPVKCISLRLSRCIYHQADEQ
jgi:hypothetical protein